MNSWARQTFASFEAGFRVSLLGAAASVCSMDATLSNNRQSFFFSPFSLCRFLSFLRRSSPFLSVLLILPILPSLFVFSLFSILSFSRFISFLLFLIFFVLCWAFLSLSLFGSFWFHFIPLFLDLFCFLSFLLFSLVYSNYFSLSVFSFFSSFPHAFFKSFQLFFYYWFYSLSNVGIGLSTPFLENGMYTNQIQQHGSILSGSVWFGVDVQ